MNVLSALKPDAVLFVGDLGEADLRPAKLIKKIPFPTAVILGNHDKGNDKTGAALQAQLKLLGEIHCGWLRRNWLNVPLTVIGARPCSPGGGFYLSKEVVSVYGDLSIEEREVENLFKKHKLEKWGVGLQKGLVSYQQKTYDDELEAMEKTMNLEKRLGKKDYVTDMNRDIYINELEETERVATEIEREEYDMSNIIDDDDNSIYDDDDYGPDNDD